MFIAGKTVKFDANQKLCTAYLADMSPLAIRSTVIGFYLFECHKPTLAYRTGGSSQPEDIK
jgi:SP family general alpha glucoside:H+ symporter-like MFS transporter